MPLAADYPGSHRVNAKSNNRMIPISSLYHLRLVAPPAAVTNGYSVAHVGAAGAGTRNMVLGGTATVGGVGLPSLSRNVVITVTHGSAVLAMSGIISGYDDRGQLVTEAWSVTAGTVSKTFTGKKAFKRIISISETIAADSSTNTIIAGSGNVFGTGVKISVPSAVKEMQDAAVITTGVVLAASAVATDDPLGTYTPAASPNGVINYDAWLIADEPWNS